jgi:hypothetical protein
MSSNNANAIEVPRVSVVLLPTNTTSRGQLSNCERMTQDCMGVHDTKPQLGLPYQVAHDPTIYLIMTT